MPRRVAAHLVPVEDGPTLPTHEWGEAPEGLVTRRQLRDMGLSPGGHGPVGDVRCRACRYRPLRECTRKALLYDVEKAVPKRVPTLAQEEALDKAMAARQTCVRRRVRQDYCVRLDTRMCAACTARAEMEIAA
ncbi:hypothetical protein GCM10027160_35100 [Streptomyces calidiresistens]|uniref:RRQRL motif-containing zinc-binding protein n=1 Tax=Streptomyces calidiresistens TaxID=1485586 RepID=UPI0015FCB0AD|nr:RRQRL motif-containing zinc-binding protein [Streptomyces calidiresistens]